MRIVAFAWCTWLAACAGTVSDEPNSAESNSAALRFGDFSFADTEVGLLSAFGGDCTATLIDPQAILTAAHCVNFATGPISGSFMVEFSSTSNVTYGLDRAFSLRSEPGSGSSEDDYNNDIAVVRLANPVPSIVATPLGLSGGAVLSIGSRVTIYGYGCRSEAHDSYSRHKQRYETLFDNEIYTCYGDSGGPFIMALASGQRVISLVTSGTAVFLPWEPDHATYGLVYAHAQEIANQLDAWNGLPPGTTDVGVGGGANPPPCQGCRRPN